MGGLKWDTKMDWGDYEMKKWGRGGKKSECGQKSMRERERGRKEKRDAHWTDSTRPVLTVAQTGISSGCTTAESVWSELVCLTCRTSDAKTRASDNRVTQICGDENNMASNKLPDSLSSGPMDRSGSFFKVRRDWMDGWIGFKIHAQVMVLCFLFNHAWWKHQPYSIQWIWSL